MVSSLALSSRDVVTPTYLKLDPTSSLLGIFDTFRRMPYPAFLDSALAAPRLGQFSYLTADPFMVLRSKGRRVQIESMGTIRHLNSDPFQVLQDLLKRFRLAPVPGLPPFQGGAIGYLAYELAHHLEKLPRHAVDDLGLPEMNVAFYDWVIARDHGANATWAIATGYPEGDRSQARERLAQVEECVRRARHSPRFSGPFQSPAGLASNFSYDGYVEAVGAVKDYIASGDIYQANISQRFEATLSCEPWELYLRLRQVNPAPFAAFLSYPEVTVLSASPEQYLNMRNGTVYTRPMKGTRPRGKTSDEDRRLAAELLASEKDRAENVMIVDLLRNDLGRVCVPGSIEVPELFTIEKYPTVFQMVSSICGRTRPGVDAVDLLRACFPGGSVTGAPKIRAVEIIDELEPTQRSVYCGAIGYVGFDNSTLTSIPIRILLVKGRKVYFQVGGGIVADSDPQAEYEETLHKARGSLEALGIHE